MGLTLARTRHIPDIVIQATTVTRHIEHSAQARPISQSTMNQSTSTRTYHPEVLLKSLAFIRDKYLDISQDNHPEVFCSSHKFSSETRFRTPAIKRQRQAILDLHETSLQHLEVIQ